MTISESTCLDAEENTYDFVILMQIYTREKHIYIPSNCLLTVYLLFSY